MPGDTPQGADVASGPLSPAPPALRSGEHPGPVVPRIVRYLAALAPACLPGVIACLSR